MPTKKRITSVTATNRPVRIAYLIDVSVCPSGLLSSIFAECYSRWGGRRTLVIPTTKNGINEAYKLWLHAFDPDILYSYVDLTDSAVASIHEEFCPGHLIKHESFRKPEDAYHFSPKFPGETTFMQCQSVLPAILSRRGFREFKDLHLPHTEGRWSEQDTFLSDSFGFLSDSFGNSQYWDGFPELYKPASMIDKESLDDPRYRKSNGTQYLNEIEFLEAATKQSSYLPLSVLSDCFAPYLHIHNGNWGEAFNLVVGDSTEDRLLFWNNYLNYDSLWPYELPTLCIPKSRLEDEATIKLLIKLVEKSGRRLHNQNSPWVVLRSCSLSKDELDKLAENVKAHTRWVMVGTEHCNSSAACIPPIKSNTHMYWTYGQHGNLKGKTTDTAETSEPRIQIPRVLPWHMQDAMPPPGLRHGYWMCDLEISTTDEYSESPHDMHHWQFPRRLRLDRAISFTNLENESSYIGRTHRVTKDGNIALPLNESSRMAFQMPLESEAFKSATTESFEWISFRDRKNGPTGFPRYYEAEVSEQGRYLLGIVQLFTSFQECYQFLLHPFWEDMLTQLGAGPIPKMEVAQNNLIKAIRKRLRVQDGPIEKNPIHIDNEDALKTLAQLAIIQAKQVQKELLFRSYDTMLGSWKSRLETLVKTEPNLKGHDDLLDDAQGEFDQSLQRLCQRDVLYQGIAWTCPKCLNKNNWESIDNLESEMVCEVCNRTEPAPVSGGWQFRANGFIVNAFQGGTSTVLWAISYLAEQARLGTSFYFCPALRFYKTAADADKRIPCSEVDFLAVVNGDLIAVEAKRSVPSSGDLKRFIEAVNVLRPNIALLALGEKPTLAKESCLRKEVSNQLLSGIKLEIIARTPPKEEWWLP